VPAELVEMFVSDGTLRTAKSCNEKDNAKKIPS